MRIISSLSRKQGFIALLFLAVIFLFDRQALIAQDNLGKIEDKETAEIIKKAADYKNPLFSAVILLYDERYSVGENNKVLLKKHVLTKVLSESGKRYSTVTLPFDEYFRKLKINIARTIQPNGEIMNVSLDAISEESPYSNVPIYSDIKNKKMTFSGVEVGSVMEYEVEYAMDYKDLPGFSVLFTIPHNWMALSARFLVEVPKETHVNFKAVRIASYEPFITSTESHDTYSWKMNNIFALGSEQLFLPSYMKFGPYISFSTIKSWDDVDAGCKKLMQGQAEPDENIKAKVKELIQGIEDDRTKITKRLYEYVSQNIQYVAIEWGLSAFRPYPAAQVFKNKYGDCKGKSALLISMLEVAGIKADYAIVITVNQGFFEPSVPSVFFDHAIVAIPKDDGYIFMDPTADLLPCGELPFPVQGANALVLRSRGLEMLEIPIEPAEKNKVYADTRIYINADGSMELLDKTEFSGQQAWFGRLLAKYTNPKQYNELLMHSLNQAIPNAAVKDIKTSDYKNLDKPFSIEISAGAGGYANKAGDLLMFKLPYSLEDIFTMGTAAELREVELFMLYPQLEESKTTIKIPEQFIVKYLPQNLLLNSPVLSYKIGFENKGDKIIIDERLALKERDIPITEYFRFRNIIAKIRGIYNENIVLERKTSNPVSQGL